MGSLSPSPTSHATASRWTRSGRRCSRSSPRRTGSTRPSPASRRPPGRLSAGLIRLTVTSVITARKCSSSRSASMRPTTSSPRPTSPSRRPHRHTQTHTDTQTHRHTDTHKHRHTDTQTHRHTDTQTHSYIHIHTHTPTHTHTHTQTHTHTKPD